MDPDENQDQVEDQEESRGFGEVVERESDDENESNDEQVEEKSEDTQDESEQTDNQEDKDNENGEKKDDSQEPEQKTEKGTKLDPNPLSAAHQQLANEKRVRGQMEQVLADPAKIAKFVKAQYGIDMPVRRGEVKEKTEDAGKQEETVTTKKWEAKDFENIQDVADKFNQLQDGFKKEIADRDAKIEDMNKKLFGVLEGGRLGRIADTTESDVRYVKSLPELNPKSPEFIPGLEGQISRRYRKLDFDEETGHFKGQYSLKEIAEDFLEVAREAKKSGSQRAQTIVKDKTSGKVRTSPAVDGRADDKGELSPSQSIAQGIAKMFK